MDLMITNSQQDSNLVLPSSRVSAQHNHRLVASQKQSNQSGISNPNANFVVTISASTLMDSNNRYVCDVCGKGFPRQQNLTLHTRSHNLPYTLKTDTPKMPGTVYVCPEPTCVYHNPSRGLGDFGGLKKHYHRKHTTQKKYKCVTCSKAYTVETDLKSHLKVCGKKKYTCHCGARFSRGYNFTLHQKNCDGGEHEGAAKSSQTLPIGDSSVKSDGYNSRSIISSTKEHPPTSNMGDSSVGITSNENNNALEVPQISSNLNPFNSYPSTTPYQSQLFGCGTENGSLMIHPPMGDIPPAFFSQAFTPQNQFNFQENSDIAFYADLLMDNIRLEHVIPNTINFMGDGGDIYGRSFSSTPALHNTSDVNGMLNPVSNSGVNYSTIYQDLGASYEKEGYCSYGYGTGRYGSGMELLNYETSAAIESAGAPFVQDHGASYENEAYYGGSGLFGSGVWSWNGND